MLLITKKSYKKRITTRTTEQFIELSREVHGDRYIYDRTKYDTCNDKVIITCRIHGDFETLAKSHLDGVCCAKCNSDNKSTVDTDEFIRRSRMIHGDEYIYDKTVYTRMRQRVIITCRVHGDFEPLALNHLAGAKCGQCKSRRISKIATEWLNYMGVSSKFREIAIKEFPSRPLDAYDDETNTVYQFHGDYWHGNIKLFNSFEYNSIAKKTMGDLYQSTLEWDQQIRDLGYNLVVMWESDWKKIRKSVDIN